jgi:transcriptional regulator with XRE-family HTH domain
MKELCEMMKDLRQDHDLTQKAIAAHLGISQQCYSGYERGRCAVPTWVVTKLAQLYQVSADYLLGLDTSYLGTMNLMSIYYNDVTMYDIVYDLQKVKKKKREELLSYIKFITGDDV